MYMHAHMSVCNVCFGGRVTVHVYVDVCVCVLATGRSLDIYFYFIFSFEMGFRFGLELAKSSRLDKTGSLPLVWNLPSRLD